MIIVFSTNNCFLSDNLSDSILLIVIYCGYKSQKGPSIIFIKSLFFNMSKESLKNIILESAKKTHRKIEEAIKREKAEREAQERKKFEYATAVILELFAVNRDRKVLSLKLKKN